MWDLSMRVAAVATHEKNIIECGVEQKFRNIKLARIRMLQGELHTPMVDIKRKRMSTGIREDRNQHNKLLLKSWTASLHGMSVFDMLLSLLQANLFLCAFRSEKHPFVPLSINFPSVKNSSFQGFDSSERSSSLSSGEVLK